MGYRIAYSPEDDKKYPMKVNGASQHKWVVPIILLLLLLIGIFSMDGYDTVKTWLLPGDPAVTEAALVGMVEDIKAGEPLYDAVTSFCQEIIENAEMEE